MKEMSLKDIFKAVVAILISREAQRGLTWGFL